MRSARLVSVLFISFSLCLFHEAVHGASEFPGGSWATVCTPLPKRHSVGIDLTFQVREVHATVRLFSDHSCRVPSVTITHSGTFQIGGPHGEGHKFDHEAAWVRLVIEDEEVVVYYNSNAICGISNWVLGQARDVSGMFCEPYKMPDIAANVSDIYFLGDQGLQFGAFPRLPPDETVRPATLDSTFLFKRVE